MANGFYSVDRGCYVVRPWRRDGGRQLMGTRHLAIAVAKGQLSNLMNLRSAITSLVRAAVFVISIPFAFRCAAASAVHSTNLQAAYNRRNTASHSAVIGPGNEVRREP